MSNKCQILLKLLIKEIKTKMQLMLSDLQSLNSMLTCVKVVRV